MRKRQKPYILIMFVFVAACGVVFMSLAQSTAGQQPTGNTPPPQTGAKDITVPDKESIAKQVGGQAKNSTGPGGGLHKGMRAASDAPLPTKTDRPVVAIDAPAAYKPQPNPSSTANQWWTDQSTKTYEPKPSGADANKKSP